MSKVLVLLLMMCSQIESKNYASMTKLECANHKSQCKNAVCNYTMESPFLINITAIGCTLIRTHRKISIRVRHEVKNGNNSKYRPGLYDTVVDVCELANGFNSPILNVILPNIKERLGAIMHACPYNAGPVYLKNMLIDSTVVPSDGQMGDYRLSFTFVSGKFLDLMKTTYYGKRTVVVDGVF